MLHGAAGPAATALVPNAKEVDRGEIGEAERELAAMQEEFRDFTGKRIPVLKPLKLDRDVTRR